MASNLDALKTELTNLVDACSNMIGKFDSEPTDFLTRYQSWYTEARRVVEQLLPERLDDFTNHYRFVGNRKEVNYDTYRIVDYLQGTTVSRFGEEVFSSKSRARQQFFAQVQILQAAHLRFTSKLMDLKDILTADLYDTELGKARALHKGHLLREAGVIAGVVLEAHLQDVATNHKLKITKKSPTISDLNDPLKDAGIYDVPTWRLIQRLADIRNLCDHKKHRDPTSDEVVEFIDGVDKVTKTVF